MRKPKKGRRLKRRNPAAAALAEPRFRPRRVAAEKGGRTYSRRRLRALLREALNEGD